MVVFQVWVLYSLHQNHLLMCDFLCTALSFTFVGSEGCLYSDFSHSSLRPVTLTCMGQRWTGKFALNFCSFACHSQRIVSSRCGKSGVCYPAVPHHFLSTSVGYTSLCKRAYLCGMGGCFIVNFMRLAYVQRYFLLSCFVPREPFLIHRVKVRVR